MKGCEIVQTPPPLTISNRFQRVMHADLWSATAPFNIGYRMIYAEHRSPWQVQVEFTLEKNVCANIAIPITFGFPNLSYFTLFTLELLFGI